MIFDFLKYLNLAVLSRKNLYIPDVCVSFFVIPAQFFSHSHVRSLCFPGVSVRTAWTSWWARGPSTCSKMLILGAATCATHQSAAETSNSDQTGA